MKKAFKDDEIMKDEELESIKDKQEDYLKMYKIVNDISKAMEKKANTLKIEVKRLLRRKKDIADKSYNVRVWGNFSQSAEPRVVIESTGKPQAVMDIVVSAKGYRFVAFTRSKSNQSNINNQLEENGFKWVDWQDFLNDKNPTTRALITEIPDTTPNNLVCDSDCVFHLNYNNEKDTKINKEEETIQIAKIGVKIYEQICNFESND